MRRVAIAACCAALAQLAGLPGLPPARAAAATAVPSVPPAAESWAAAQPGSTEMRDAGRSAGPPGRDADAPRGLQARAAWLRPGAHRAGAGRAAVGTRPGSGLARSDGRAARADRWIQAQIADVVSAGVLGTDAESFRPADPLTRGELEQALAALGLPARLPGDPARLVTMRELDARIVGALGLGPAARRYRLAASAAGLDPTGMLGTETVARSLRLRFDHPPAQEALELGPGDIATRAEAAFSLARVMRLTPGQIAAADGVSRTFALPPLGERQRTVLRRALQLVGYPYVWTGSSEKTQELWSATAPGGLVSAPGGFDCSGFVWRVYKLDPLPGGLALGGTIKGRTSYAMSAEVPRRDRITLDELQPGDLAFFGDRGPRSRTSAIGHMGIYLGNGFMVHASGNGVTVVPLEGWYRTSFAWGRRPLAEAGLAA